MDIKNNILETIGNTPIIRLNKLTSHLPCLVTAKVDYFNPGNSIKDRMALKMVEVAEQEGKLKPGGTIIEGTSGNTGMGLALAACVKGYKCIFVTTDKQSKEKADIVTYDIVVTGELKDEILNRVPGESFKVNGDHYWHRKDKHHGSMMYRTSLGKRVRYEKRFTDTTTHPQEDWRLWEMMLASGASVSSISEGLLFYRRHRENFLKYKTGDSVKRHDVKRELQTS
jgi:hypothetical protein